MTAAALHAVEPATLETYRDHDGTLWAWCEHERIWHRHGGGCTCPEYIGQHPDPHWDGECRCFGTGDGHRGAHCRCPESPHHGRGYVLREVGQLTADVLAAHPETGYLTGCRENSCRLARATRRDRMANPTHLPEPKDPLSVAHLILKGYADPDFTDDDPAYDGYYLTYDLTAARSWMAAANDDPDFVDLEPMGEPADGDGLEHIPMLRYEPTLDGPLVLRRWRGTWMRWHRTHWAELEDTILTAELYSRLGAAVWQKRVSNKVVTVPWMPNRSSVGEVLKALEGLTVLPAETEAPIWLDGRGDPDPLVSCRNGLLNIETRELHAHEPDWFNLVAIPFDYDPEAPAPTRWLHFLDQLWPGDPASIAALQEWFGYVVSGRTDLQKMLMIVGPPRAGKGTIVRILQQLVGRANYAGPTLASLATNFGLQELIGKPLAVIADARLGGKDTHIVVERLLSITGEDTITLDRKYRDLWTGSLPTRLMLLSNEIPHFGDASGAIATRFIALALERSWLGKEDITLERGLRTEMPGILRWALDGLERLTDQGRLTEPASSAHTILAMTDSASPTGAFVRDRCEIGAGHEVPVSVLFAAWLDWCNQNGREHRGTVQTFGRALMSVVPAIRLTRPRDPATGQQVRTYTGIGVSRSEPHSPYLYAQGRGVIPHG